MPIEGDGQAALAAEVWLAATTMRHFQIAAHSKVRPQLRIFRDLEPGRE